jgi:DegV family protein with EDD domain
VAEKELPITVADSKHISIGQWWVAKHAAWVAKKGASIKQIMEEVSEIIPKIQLLAVLETFENLKKGGRAEQIKGLFASMLSAISIHPILGLKDGKLDIFGKARNSRKARAKIVEMVGDMGELVKVAVIHTNALELAEEVRNSLDKISTGMIPIVDAGPALATHAGEKAVAIVSQLK